MKTAAETAKAIRNELKSAFPEIKFKVTSSNFSMGNSVDVDYIDGVRKSKVEEIVNKYQYGKFNSMEDIYEHSNEIAEIPQVKFVHVYRKLSDTAKNEIIESLNIYAFDEQKWYDSDNCYGSTLIHRASHKKDF